MYIIKLKSSLMYYSSWDRSRLMKNFCFTTICNTTQGPPELEKYNCICGFTSKSVVIKYYQLLSKVMHNRVSTN